MDRSTLIAALSAVDGTPSKARLRQMKPEKLAELASKVGVTRVVLEGSRVELEGRVDRLERELERDGLVTNQPPSSDLGFTARSTLGVGPGDATRFERGGGSKAPRNRDRRGGDRELSFQVRSTLGVGPGDASWLDRKDSPERARNDDAGDSSELGFTPRSTLGAGPGSTERFDR